MPYSESSLGELLPWLQCSWPSHGPSPSSGFESPERKPIVCLDNRPQSEPKNRAVKTCLKLLQGWVEKNVHPWPGLPPMNHLVTRVYGGVFFTPAKRTCNSCLSIAATWFAFAEKTSQSRRSLRGWAEGAAQPGHDGHRMSLRTRARAGRVDRILRPRRRSRHLRRVQ